MEPIIQEPQQKITLDSLGFGAGNPSTAPTQSLDEVLANTGKAVEASRQEHIQTVLGKAPIDSYQKAEAVYNEANFQIEDGATPSIENILAGMNGKDPKVVLKDQQVEDDTRMLNLAQKELVEGVKSGQPIENLKMNAAFLQRYGAGKVPMGQEKEREYRIKRQQESNTMVLNMIAQGMPKDYIEDRLTQLDGLVQPLYDPIDLTVDLATGGTSLLLKEGGKVTSKALTKAALIDAGYGVMAGGIMALADSSDIGPAFTALSGIFGTMGAGALLTTSRRGMAQVLKELRKNDVVKYRQTVDALTKAHGTVAETVVSIAKELDTGKVVTNINGNINPKISPAANIALMAEAESTKKLQAICGATISPSREVSTLAKHATGTGDVALATLMPGVVNSKANHLLQGHEELGEFFYNANIINERVANHAYIDSQIANKQTELLHTRTYNDGTITHGPTAEAAINKAKTAKVSTRAAKIFHPMRWLGDMQQAFQGIPSALGKKVQSYAKGASDFIVKDTYKGLKPDEVEQLDNLFRHSNDWGEILKEGPGGLVSSKDPSQVIYVTDKIKDKYYSTMLMMEHFYDQTLAATNRTLSDLGYKMLDDGAVGVPYNKATPNVLKYGYTDVNGKVWTREMQEQGWTAFKLTNLKNKGDERNLLVFLDPSETAHRIKDINPRLQTIPKRQGYTPFIVDPKKSRFFITEVTKDANTGAFKVNHVAGAHTKVEAEEAVKAMKDLHDDPFKQYVVHLKDDTVDYVDLAFNDEMIDTLRHMDSTEALNLRRALAASGRFSEAEIKGITGQADTYGYSNAHHKKRSDVRIKSAKSIVEEVSKLKAKGTTDTPVSDILSGMMQKARKEQYDEFLDSNNSIKQVLTSAEEAPLLPTGEAMARYINTMSNYINMSEWNSTLKRMFTEKYGDVLTVPRHAKDVTWDAPVNFSNEVNASEVLRSKALEAQVIQEQLRQIFNVPTVSQLQSIASVKNLADKAFNNPKTEFIGRTLLNAFPKGWRYSTADHLKKLSAHAFLGLFNPSQAIVQLTSIFHMGKYAAMHPKKLAAGFNDAHDIFVLGYLGGKAGLEVPEDAKYLLDLVQKSGYVTRINFEDAASALRAVENGNPQSKFGSFWNGVKDASFWPMKFGENLPRLVAFSTERRLLIDEIESGVHKTLKASDIDQDVFLAEVIMRADNSMGDFTRFNKPVMTRDGMVSAMTQYMQWPLHTAEYMFGKGMTIPERMGTLGAWFGAFGVGGIPFIWTLAAGVEGTLASVGHPEAKNWTKKKVYKVADETAEMLFGKADYSKYPHLREFTRRLILKGGFNAATEGEIDIVNRAGAGDALIRMVDGLGYADLAGPGAQVLTRLIAGGVTGTKDLVGKLSSGELSEPNAAWEVMEKYAGPLATPKNIAKGMQTPIRNTRGDIAIEDPTVMQRASTMIGITPGGPVEHSERRYIAWTDKQAVDTYINDKAKEISKMFNSSPKQGVAALKAELQFIAEEGKHPEYIGKLYKSVIIRTIFNNVAPELSTELMELKLHSELPNYLPSTKE